MTSSAAVIVAAIGALSAILSPLLLAHLLNAQRRKEKQEDWRRQDEVAAKVDAAAGQAATAAELLVESNKVSNMKLDGIHDLVNSKMTAALDAQLVALESNVVLMRREIARQKESGQEPTAEDLASLKATEAKVSELRAQVHDRLSQSGSVSDEADL